MLMIVFLEYQDGMILCQVHPNYGPDRKYYLFSITKIISFTIIFISHKIISFTKLLQVVRAVTLADKNTDSEDTRGGELLEQLQR